MSQLLFSVRFRNTDDSWIWTIDSTSSFSVKSLMDDLVGYDNKKNMDIYSTLIKIFLWELSLSAIKTADRLQRNMPYIALAPSLCHMFHSHSESAAHLFLHCNFAECFWYFILQDFGWSGFLS